VTTKGPKKHNGMTVGHPWKESLKGRPLNARFLEGMIASSRVTVRKIGKTKQEKRKY